MFVNDNYFTEWMEKLSKKLSEIGKDLKSLVSTNKVFDNGEKPLDNQDLCLMLHVSPRTLQRYRSEGLLPFSKRGQKIYYKTSDVREFVYRNGDHWDKKALEDAVAKKKIDPI
ncbi:MAG: helix-turn-helix domain-containing protein, partial [Bacteroidales bacterium]|nr:helix-turn-helix domain-containing protein [Bacteroidales bacterium]